MDKKKATTVLIRVRVGSRQVIGSWFLREFYHVMSHDFQRTMYFLKIRRFFRNFKIAEFQVNAQHFAT
jgi:hypothetical protein